MGPDVNNESNVLLSIDGRGSPEHIALEELLPPGHPLPPVVVEQRHLDRAVAQVLSVRYYWMFIEFSTT